MFSVSELLLASTRYRLDAICLGLIAIAACDYARGYVRRRGADQDFSRATSVLVIAWIAVGALLAEETVAILGYPAPLDPVTILLARGAVLGAAALFGALLLVGAVRF